MDGSAFSPRALPLSQGALRRWRRGRWAAAARVLAAETPIALSYNRIGHAVMLATPADLEDFALGFSLAEGIVDAAVEIEDLQTVAMPSGIELRMWIAPERLSALQARRRRMAGPTGCGLCGLESLEAALRAVPSVPDGPRLSPEEVLAAMASLAPAQRLNRATGAMHAAGYWQPGRGLVALREDVGRHNALDKLAGVLARAGGDAAAGMVVLTSRVSIEMVQKAARMRATLLAAVSAPTALAVAAAAAAGLTLIGPARADGFEVHAHPERLEA